MPYEQFQPTDESRRRDLENSGFFNRMMRAAPDWMRADVGPSVGRGLGRAAEFAAGVNQGPGRSAFPAPQGVSEASGRSTYEDIMRQYPPPPPPGWQEPATSFPMNQKRPIAPRPLVGQFAQPPQPDLQGQPGRLGGYGTGYGALANALGGG